MVLPSSEERPLLKLSPHCQNKSPAIPLVDSASEACCHVFSTLQWFELTPSVKPVSARLELGRDLGSLTLLQQTRLVGGFAGSSVGLNPSRTEAVIHAPCLKVSSYRLPHE